MFCRLNRVSIKCLAQCLLQSVFKKCSSATIFAVSDHKNDTKERVADKVTEMSGKFMCQGHRKNG